MRKFGIEIRKTGDITNLYKDVDLVLSNSGMKSGEVSAAIQVQTVAHCLQKMLNPDKWLSVTDIEKCATICHICISKERMNIYNAAHCINWNEMTPEYRQTLMAMILDDFREVLNP